VSPSGKDRIDEMQARGRRQRAAAFVSEIKQRGEAMRDIFLESACDVCKGRLVRHESARGFVCVNGHRADLGAAKRRLEALHSAKMKAIDHEKALLDARLLQRKRKQQQGRP